MAREEWVKVESAGELCPGGAVQYRPCGLCGKIELGTFARFENQPTPCFFCGVPCIGILVLGGCHDPNRFCCASRAIRDGRLYRRRELPDEQATEAAKPKALERVRP